MELKDTRLRLNCGIYLFKWKGIDLSYRASSLEYTILNSFSHCDSGMILDSWVDEDGEIFYDAKECLCWC